MFKTGRDDFYRLNANPFGETPDPRFFFASTTHQSALQSLRLGLEQGKGFVLLTGEVGMGKTLVSRILLEALGPDTDSALILYPNCTEAELIRSICTELEIPLPPSDASGHKSDLDRLNDFLLQNAQRGRKTVLLIDEVQNMPDSTLETLRLLSNLETHNQKLIQMVLCAQPEFLGRLSMNCFRQLNQRIGLQLRLDRLNTSETERYIKHRIECAGGSNFLRFDADACKMIQKTASGIPRQINRLCDQLMAVGRQRGARLITKTIARSLLDSTERKSWLSRLWSREESRQP